MSGRERAGEIFLTPPYMCYDPRAHRVCEVHGSVPNLTQELLLNSKNGFIEAHGLTEEPTERPKSS